MLSEQAQLQQVANIAGIRIPAQVSVKNHHVILRKRRFHYREWGKPSAPGLLFLHGGNQTCHTWNVICAALSDQYHCIALDQRGHGDSEWSYEGDYALTSQMKDIVALIDHLEWPSLTIIGMSMGCLVGLYYVIKYPTSLDAFVAIDAGPYVEPAGAAKIKNFVDDNRRHGSLEDYIAAAVAFNPRRNPLLLRHSLQRNLRRLVDGRWEWKTDNRITQLIPQLLESIKELVHHIGNIDCPVLIMRGDDSEVFSDANAQQFCGELKHGHYVTIENAGHSIQGDNPKALLRALKPFLTKVVRSAAHNTGIEAI